MASAPSGDKRSSAADAGAAPRAPRPGAGDGSRDDLRIKRSGRYLASLMSVAEPLDAASARDAPMAALLDPRVRGAATEEMKHEIIGLGERLVVNEENLAALKSSVDPDAPALIVSFLGDTSAGKSHTIRQLMSASESRPFCQNARGQSMATTFNVNLFPCTSIAPGMVVHLVDYEGENGSNTPVMMAVSPTPSRARERGGARAARLESQLDSRSSASRRAPLSRPRCASVRPSPTCSCALPLCRLACRRLGASSCGRDPRCRGASRWPATSRASPTQPRT